MRESRYRWAFALATTFLCFGCAGPDFAGLAKYYGANPRTILVLPVQNLTTDAEAPRFFLSTIGKPLIARGYYVLPPHLVAAVLAGEGVDLAGESWEIKPALLGKHFGADGVLYITITDWDTTYLLLHTTVTVGLHFKLFDTRSGSLLWEHKGTQVVQSDSGSSGGDPLANLIGSLISAAVTAAATDYVPMAAKLNQAILAKLPPGHYHREYAVLQERIAEWKQRANSKAATICPPGQK